MDNNLLRVGECCGSCIHTETPAIPTDHAAYYSVAKTERWCHKHSCHVTRETVCDDYEGVTRPAKTCKGRVVSFNKRLERIRAVVNAIKNKKMSVGDRTYCADRGCLLYSHSGSSESYHWYRVSSKEKNHDDEMTKLEEELSIK